MITPQFNVSQDDEFLILEIKAPYIKAQEVEIDISGTELRFYAKPYFLRLHFKHSIIENGLETSRYDISSGIVYLKIPKENKCQYFDDLDLLTTLLDIKVADRKPAIEIINDSESIGLANENEIDAGIAEDKDEEIDWSFKQTLPSKSPDSTKYGFNNQYQGMSANMAELADDIFEVKNLDHSSRQSRRIDRLASEDIAFDPEYYKCDYINIAELQEFVNYRPETWKLLQRIQQFKSHVTTEKIDHEPILSNEDRQALASLPNKEYLIDSEARQTIYLGIVDILFAYSYDHRTTMSDNTVESCWTICKLSGTLSSFDQFDTLAQVVSCCLRRSISFPLYRSFDLSLKVFEDVVVLLKLGKRAIIKAFISIKALTSTHEAMFLFDRIYITDYLVWLQKYCSDRILRGLASELHHYKYSRQALCEWDLDGLEVEARQLLQEDKS